MLTLTIILFEKSIQMYDFLLTNSADGLNSVSLKYFAGDNLAASGNNLLERVKESLLQHAEVANGLITERALCKRLKVGRSTIRDALGSLQEQGLIERRKKKGTSLRRPGLKEIVDLWDTRCALEGMAIRLACPNFTEADLQNLRDLCDRRAQAAASRDHAAVDRLDIEFHQKILDVSGNQVIKDIVQKTHLFDRIFRIAYTVPSYWPEDESQPYGHREIVEMLSRRDAARSEDLMRQHIQEAKKRRIEAAIGKLNLYA
jgi:DNA-binding GntR family transcriptional regulator